MHSSGEKVHTFIGISEGHVNKTFSRTAELEDSFTAVESTDTRVRHLDLWHAQVSVQKY